MSEFFKHRIYGGGGGVVDVTPRGPLPMPHCYTCPSPQAYDKGLPWTPPIARDYLRGSFWSRVVPGLPFAPGNVGWSGGSGEFPERLVQGLDYKYDRAQWWPKMIEAVKSCGDTHWLRWWGNARVDGSNSEEQFVDDCLHLKSHGLYVKVWLGAKDADPKDASATDNINRHKSLVEKLQRANACDEYTPGGEWDLWNVPGRPTIDFWKWVGQRAHEVGATCWGHFSSEKTSWFADGEPRGRYGFWDDLGGDVDGLDYQANIVLWNVPVAHGDYNWDIGEFQARLVDTLKQFGEQGNRHKLRAMEYSALESFTKEHPNGIEHDSLGYLASCTHDGGGGSRPNGPAHVWGSGDGYWGGCTLPDGSPLAP